MYKATVLAALAICCTVVAGQPITLEGQVTLPNLSNLFAPANSAPLIPANPPANAPVLPAYPPANAPILPAYPSQYLPPNAYYQPPADDPQSRDFVDRVDSILAGIRQALGNHVEFNRNTLRNLNNLGANAAQGFWDLIVGSIHDGAVKAQNSKDIVSQVISNNLPRLSR